MNTSRISPAVSIALVAWMGVAPASADATSPSVQCGSVITADTTLSAALTNCAGDGLIVAADDIVLDLNGHTVAGDGLPAVGGVDVGIRVEGHHGITVTNGTVSGFDVGVLLDASTGNTVSRLDVHDNAGRGVMLANSSDDNRVEHNGIAHNGRAAVALVDSQRNLVQDNLALEDAAGVNMSGASQNVIAGNTVRQSGPGVRVLDGSDRNVIDHNNLNADGSEGVEVIFSDSNAITRNHIDHTGSGVILESSDHTVITDNDILHSVASACDGCGIAIQIYGNDNLVARNTALDSPRYGIEVDDFQDPGHSPARGNVLRGNVVNGSGEGIAIGPKAGGVVLDTLIEHNIVVNAVDDGIQLLAPRQAWRPRRSPATSPSTTATSASTRCPASSTAAATTPQPTATRCRA
jgi:parallel beta-helix repeat protein